MDTNTKSCFVALANFLHVALGSEFEIVLHDVEDNEHKIAFIANGHISGRTEDDYNKDSLFEIIGDADLSKDDFLINSEGIVHNNKVIKHSSYFIKDDTDNLTGVLCINFDGSKYVNLAKQLLQLTNMDNASIENDSLHSYDFQNSVVSNLVSDIANTVIDDALGFSDIPADMLSQDEKMDIIRELNKKEVFLMKGSITNAAKRLGVSKATIYRYLQTINEEE